MSALHENTLWRGQRAARAVDTTGAASARRRRATSATVWSASVLAHAAVLAVIVSRLGTKTIEPPVVPPIAIEVVAPAKPAPTVAPLPPQPQTPPPKPAPRRRVKAAPPKPLAPVRPVAPAAEHATPQPPNTTPAQPAASTQAAAPAPVATSAPVAPEPPVTPPIGNAAYLRNPAPRYPEAAQEEGWEGRVVLRIHVDASGHPASVDVRRSSGHDVLDNAALAAVRRWTFVPARRGATPIDGWVDVPLDFRLN